MEVVLLSPDFKYNLNNSFNESDVASIKELPAKKVKESILGKIALKKAYNLYNQRAQDHKRIEILKNKDGMPFIKNNPKLSCSISHSSGYAVATVGSKTIGIDIEKIRAHKKELSDYLLLPEELRHVSERNLNLTITKTWVIKEAVLKAIGLGFKLSPKKIKICKKVKNNYLVTINNEDRLHKKKFNVLAFRWKSFYIAIAMETHKDEKYKINWNNLTSVQLPKIKDFY
ncbi:MAG: 4'-phosphopantetheinyl transferase superfamily protein [Candidatus Pacearchaeota archaeon]